MAEALYYLSFADAERPKGEQWLGGCYIRGVNKWTAMQNAWKAGCNPGGEVQILMLPSELAHRVPPDKIGRLLDRKEIEV